MEIPRPMNRASRLLNGLSALRVLLAAGLPAAALAQSVNLTVDAAQTVRVVDERVFGVNSVIWDPQASSPQTISLLQAAGVRTIRVPGGSLSDEYHWRINKSLDNAWSWSTGFDKFIQLVTAVDAQAFVTVNYGSGTPEEAAAWVAYANGSQVSAAIFMHPPIGPDAKGYDWRRMDDWVTLRSSAPLATDDGMNFLRISRDTPLGIKYWEIGNECYGTWETDQQAVPHDPVTYANRVRDYIAKMKSVDPSIKVGVVVVTTAENASYHNWTPVMLARLQALNVTPDFVIYHSYPQAPGSESDARLLQQAGTWRATAADLRQQLTAYLGGAAAGVEIVVTENNSVYSNPGKQSTSLVNGLYLADSIANILQTEINGFMWWDVRNGPPSSNEVITGNMSPALYGWRTYGDYGMLSTPINGGSASYYEAYPAYYAMKLLSNFAREGDTMVRASSDSSLLAVYAAKRSDGSLGLLVINKDPGNTLNARIALANHPPAATASVYSYGIPQDNAAKPGGSGATDLATSFMSVPGPTFTASFAPYSATVISLGRSSGPATPVTPAPPSTPAPGSGGGGGAYSPWFLSALALLTVLRRWRRRVSPARATESLAGL
jgi:alpha-N-arabinofuranosidase